MLDEFYDFIAKNTLNFFQCSSMRPGERYCLKLDNEEMVRGVDEALRKRTKQNGIQGIYTYSDVYSTFTIKLGENWEVVVASKCNGMEDDFLATLRNAELTSRHFPILMIVHSAKETITSGTGDLAANGMPFHTQSIINKVKDDIAKAQLSIADKTLLEDELRRKQMDRFSDKSSLYEYSDLLVVLGRGYVQKSDYPAFGLIPDPAISTWEDPKKIKERLQDNHTLFEMIDREYKHGNIADGLGGEFDKPLVDFIEKQKKKALPWFEDQTYDSVKASQERLRKKQNNPLQINDTDFVAYCGTPIEYSFEIDRNFFIRSDGESKSKQRKKNLLIFNPDCKQEITISIATNTTIKQSGVECVGGVATASSRKITVELIPNGCTFARVKIKDTTNNVTYTIKICALNILPSYLESIQTSYMVSVNKALSQCKIQVLGIQNDLIINPEHEKSKDQIVESDAVVECTYDETLHLAVASDQIEADTGSLDFSLKIGSVSIPMQIQDEPIKPTVLTGAGAFLWKHENRKSLEYREGNKIVSGTKEYFAKERFNDSLECERVFLKENWLAVQETIDGYKEYPISIPDSIREAYLTLLQEFHQLRTVPSLAYYDKNGSLYRAAVQYVSTVAEKLYSIPAGQTLSPEMNDLLLLGCIVKDYDEHAISMSPLQPLNIAYQLKLLEENAVGNIRENLVEKLTSLYLLPYIRDREQNYYHAIEQKHSPEWRYYAPISNKRYQGARNFVQTLVCNKIIQYREHFTFLFDDIDNNLMCINLVNMGDCKEIFNGLLRFYNKCMKEDTDPEDLLHFNINVYADQDAYNVFSLLADLKKLKAHISEIYTAKEVEDPNELAVIMTSKVRCFYRSPEEPEYQYAHLTFYEMESIPNSGASRMDLITTGVSLEGITSGVPSVLNTKWYKTGFGTKYAKETELLKLSKYYNALFRVAFSGSSFEPDSCVFTEIAQGQEGQLGKIYKASNWVVFVDPKVDLSFFQKRSNDADDLMIIHYSDQYTSASGYDDITVTQKSNQYNQIIHEQLQKKGVTADSKNITEIINLFNAINGSWMLRLIATKKQSGAADSYFSREKMSILSAIKFCMAYYTHPDIVWIPISLEEMLRVSGGAGLSQKEGLLSAKNLGFEARATSDDILFVGVQGPKDDIKIYLHPIEVKIGQNHSNVIAKAKQQVQNTYEGLWKALWPDDGRDDLERKLSRNFFMQLILVCCEKMKLYNIYSNEDWDLVLSTFRENLLNEKYRISDEMDQYMGKGTVVSFGSEVHTKSGKIDENGVCFLEMPEKCGSNYMVLSLEKIEEDLTSDTSSLPGRLINVYRPDPVISQENQEEASNHQDSQSTPDTSVENTVCIKTEPSIVEKKQDTSSETAADPEIITPSEEVSTDSADEKAENTAQSTTGSKSNTDAVENEKIGIQVLFGTDKSTGAKLYWCPNDTNQVFHTNTGIIGTMGTGKTQFTKSMIAQMYRERKYNFASDQLGILIFDYKGDYNESKEDFVSTTNATILKPYHLPFNPLALTKSKVFKPLLPIHTANAFKDTLSKVYALGPKQQNALFQCIIEAYAAKGIMPGDPGTWDNTPPTFDMVYSLYSSNDDIKKTDSLAAAMDKLYQFQIFEPNPKQTKSLFELLNGVVVIDLSGYDSDIQSLIVAITLDLFYAQMQAAGSSKLDNRYRQLTKLILVDEADNFMSEGFPALKKILKEGREFGVGTILSTQFLRHFGSGEDDYSKYILTWVVHNVSDLKNSDVEFVFKTETKSAETQTLYNDIKALGKHNSIVKIGNDKPRYIVDRAFWELYKEIQEENI